VAEAPLLTQLQPEERTARFDDLLAPTHCSPKATRCEMQALEPAPSNSTRSTLTRRKGC